jgi:hypothetical protein
VGTSRGGRRAVEGEEQGREKSRGGRRAGEGEEQGRDKSMEEQSGDIGNKFLVISHLLKSIAEECFTKHIHKN